MNVLKILMINLVAIICAASAFALAYMDKSGWGWFLLISIFTVHTFESEEKSENQTPHQNTCGINQGSEPEV